MSNVAEMSGAQVNPGIDPHTMSIIVTKGSLDWAYPPFIIGTTAAAMGFEVTMFFTFYGLPLLMKDLKLQVSSLGNPAMKMPMMGMHMGMPNLVSAIPGVDAAASKMMKNLIKYAESRFCYPWRRCRSIENDEEPDQEERCRLDTGTKGPGC
jgi:peroxiredoxin family protein